jgi:hypothetical protein
MCPPSRAIAQAAYHRDRHIDRDAVQNKIGAQQPWMHQARFFLSSRSAMEQVSASKLVKVCAVEPPR